TPWRAPAHGPRRTPPGPRVRRGQARSDARPRACGVVRAPGQSAPRAYTPWQGVHERRPTAQRWRERGEARDAGLHHRLLAPPGGDLRVRAGPGAAAALAGTRHGSPDG